MFDECALDGMKPPVSGKSFNRGNFHSRNGSDGHLTRRNRLVIDKDRASATQPHPATELGAGKAQVCS
jgi:hypothetical protein